MDYFFKKTKPFKNEYRERSLYERMVLKKYNVSIEDVARMLNSQDLKCKICATFLSNYKFNIDHDHETGLVRGILCLSCNISIGHMHESIDVLYRMIEYIRNSGDI